MKNLFAYFALCLTVAFGLAVSSCGTQCKGVDCGTHGTCDEADGKCACVTGYSLTSGTNAKCDSLNNAKFIGSWMSSETCTPAVDANPYTITISAVSGDLTMVRISNFSRSNCGTDPLVVTATIDGTNLKSYTTTCADITGLSGSSNLSSDGKTLNVNYALTVGGTAYTCSASMAKQ